MPMISLLSSGCVPCDLFHQPLIKPSVLTGSKQCVYTKLSSSTSPVAVVDGLDCLPNDPQTPWLKLRPEILKDKSCNGSGGRVLDCFYNPIGNQVVRLHRQDCLQVPDTARCFTATKEWLGFVVPNYDCPVYLTNPFKNNKSRTSCDLIQLPSMATMPTVWGVNCDPKTSDIDVFKFGTREDGFDNINLSTIIGIQMVGETSTQGEFRTSLRTMCSHDIVSYLISHLTFSGFDPNDKDCIVMALQGETPRLAYSRIWEDGKRKLRWIGLQENFYPGFNCRNQVVFSDVKNLFYTINDHGIQAYDLHRDLKKRSKMVFVFPYDDIICQLKKYEWEHNSIIVDRVLRKMKDYVKSQEMEGIIREVFYKKVEHLVSLDNGDLLLIIRHGFCKSDVLERTWEELHWEERAKFRATMDMKTLHFDVYRVNFSHRRLEHLTTLGERSIFVGCNQSFSLCAHQFPGLHPNSIYFTNIHEYRLNGEDCGIFNLDDGNIHLVTYPYTPHHLHPNVESQESDTSLGWKELFWISPPTPI